MSVKTMSLKGMLYPISNTIFSAIYGMIGLCFGHDTYVGLCYDILKGLRPIIGLRGPSGPFNIIVSPKSADKFDFRFMI